MDLFFKRSLKNKGKGMLRFIPLENRIVLNAESIELSEAIELLDGIETIDIFETESITIIEARDNKEYEFSLFGNEADISNPTRLVVKFDSENEDYAKALGLGTYWMGVDNINSETFKNDIQNFMELKQVDTFDEVLVDMSFSASVELEDIAKALKGKADRIVLSGKNITAEELSDFQSNSEIDDTSVELKELFEHLNVYNFSEFELTDYFNKEAFDAIS